MKRIFLTATLLVAIISFSAAPSVAFSTASATSSQAAALQQGAMVPVNFSSALGSFQGVFDITRFAVQNGQLVATGLLNGVVRDALGNVVGNIVDQALTLPVILGQSTGSCDILHLELGPLDLNLLGLVVHLDQVVLDITAQQGPGSLLGNLLCAVAGLLDAGGPLQAISRLLNQILRILG